MRASVTKRARRLARKLSIGMVDRELVTYNSNKSTAVNNLKSTRGIYRHIKRLLRAGFSITLIEKVNANADTNTAA